MKKKSPDAYLQPWYTNPRWRVLPAYDDQDQPIEDLWRVTVVTASGTGKRAQGWAYVSDEGAKDRRLMAATIRDARNAAMRFRRNSISADERESNSRAS